MSEQGRGSGEDGYICVWGTSTREKVTDSEGVIIQCGGCGEVAQMIGKSAVPYCSIFYIPLFPEGGGEDFIQCTNCGGKFQGSTAEIRSQIEAQANELEEEIAKKRRVYETEPGNVDKASDLAELYMAADRVAEARRLAESLVGLHAEDANVLLLYGRILLEQEEWRKSLEMMDRASALSPQHAGIHYYRAIALASGPAPRFGSAVESAREAQRCGHPEARELVRALESAQGEQG